MGLGTTLALGGIGSSLIGGLTSLFGSKSQFNEQQKLINLQYQKNLEQWNRENEYNAPKAQMERLRDAGLNPNLVYGNGNNTAGTAASSPSYGLAEAPNIIGEIGKVMQYNMMQTMNMMQQIQQTQAKVDTMESQRSLWDSMRILNGFRSAGLDFQNKIQKMFGMDLASASLSNLVQNIEKTKSEIQVNGSRVQLNQSTMAKIDEQIGLLRRQTKLTDTQIEELGWKMKEIAAQIQVDNANAFNLRQLGFFNMARTAGQRLQNSFMSQTMPFRVSNERFKAKQAHLDFARDYQTFDYLVTQEKFKSLSAGEQYKVINKWLDKQTAAQFLGNARKLKGYNMFGINTGELETGLMYQSDWYENTLNSLFEE